MQERGLRVEVHLEVIGVERGHSSGASTVRTNRVEETPSDQEGGQGSVLTGLLSGGVAQRGGQSSGAGHLGAGGSSWHSDSVSQESSSWYL